MTVPKKSSSSLQWLFLPDWKFLVVEQNFTSPTIAMLASKLFHIEILLG